jgi:NAD(P)-dependent dehydrogenase (short-subunit alcohol dehydrogenase family)
MNGIMLVTGASRGIGAAIAKQAGRQGYAVAVNYLNSQDATESIVSDINKAGGKAIAIQADTSREEDVLRLFETVDKELGTLSALINNAGVVDVACRVDEMSVERMERIFTTNITGYFMCAREAVKRMSSRHGGKGGCIINISSAAARLGSAGEYVDYAASKGATDTMTTGLAKEVAKEGIRVNAVRPGPIHTDIHASGGEPDRINRIKSAIPMGRGGTPEEISDAVMWLVSDGASYVTGAFLDVSGGR